MQSNFDLLTIIDGDGDGDGDGDAVDDDDDNDDKGENNNCCWSRCWRVWRSISFLCSTSFCFCCCCWRQQQQRRALGEIDVVRVNVKCPVSRRVQDMKLAMSVYKTSLHLSKSPHHILDSRGLIIVWPQERQNLTYDHNGVIDEKLGVRTPYQANAQCREWTPTIQHGRQEPTLPAPDCNQVRMFFFCPQHTCAYIACLLCQHKVRGHFFING